LLDATIANEHAAIAFLVSRSYTNGIIGNSFIASLILSSEFIYSFHR